jgi:hypothetical protein
MSARMEKKKGGVVHNGSQHTAEKASDLSFTIAASVNVESVMFMLVDALSAPHGYAGTGTPAAAVPCTIGHSAEPSSPLALLE